MLASNPDQVAYVYLYKYIEIITPAEQVPKLSIVAEGGDTSELKIDSLLALKLIRKDANSTVKCVNARYFVRKSNII